MASANLGLDTNSKRSTFEKINNLFKMYWNELKYQNN